MAMEEGELVREGKDGTKVLRDAEKNADPVSCGGPREAPYRRLHAVRLDRRKRVGQINSGSSCVPQRDAGAAWGARAGTLRVRLCNVMTTKRQQTSAGDHKDEGDMGRRRGGSEPARVGIERG